MTFLFPLGLLGLLGVPVIILIYILQSKYTEQVVNSTYIWTLSEKFLKRRSPLSGMAGIISLILQLLIVITLSLAISRPVISFPGGAYDYCFLLDATGSMTAETDGERGFDRARDEIETIIRRAKGGSSFTVITLGAEPVTEFEAVRDKKTALEQLDEITCTDTTASHADLLSVAQSVFDNDPAARIYLVTDKSYEAYENIEVISVGEAYENYAVFNELYTHTGGTLTVKADAISYSSDALLTLELYADGKLLATEDRAVKAGVQTPVELSARCASFSEMTLSVKNADGYAADNAVTAYNTQSDKSYSVLIVSESGFFLRAVIDALVDSDITVVDPDEYQKVTEQYGLYIFDDCTPPSLPDGAVWLINADESIEDAGFGVRGKVEVSGGAVMERSSSSATQVKRLLRGVSEDEIHIVNYVKYSGMYLNFHTLFSYDSNPLVFAGNNGLGNRQVVFGFDLHESDFALTVDYVMLMRNLLEYSFPDVLDSTAYTVGDEVLVNVAGNVTALRASSPSGKDIFMESNGSTAAISLDEVGTYTVTVTAAGQETKYKLFSGAHPDESRSLVTEPDFSLVGEAQASVLVGEYDLTTLLFILLAVLFMADWGVYLYEKYQLR